MSVAKCACCTRVIEDEAQHYPFGQMKRGPYCDKCVSCAEIFFRVQEAGL